MAQTIIAVNNALATICHQLSRSKAIRPTLEKIGINTSISLEDIRASYLTNAFNQNEWMSYLHKQVGQTQQK